MRGTRHHLISVTVLLVFIASPYAEVAAKKDGARRYFTSDDALLETGRGQKVRPVQDSLAEMKIVSYNIRWRGGDELRKLIEFLRTDPEVGDAMILGLQEVDRNKKRSGKTNNAKLMADELGMHYAWAAPPTAKANQEEETGVAILSAFPLHDVRRIVLPHHGPDKRRRVALGATIQMAGTKIRFYSVHSETRIAVGRKLEQMQAVLDDLATWPHDLPVVVLGDLNTWEPSAGKKTATLFRNAGV